MARKLMTAAVVVFAAGAALAHGPLIAAGLVLAGLASARTRPTRPDLGVGTDGPADPGHADSRGTDVREEHLDMDITTTTVPTTGTLHHLTTRAGERLAVLATRDGRHLIVYEPGADTPLRTIVLAADEADRVADLLHTPSIRDRLAALEAAVTRRHP